MIRRWTARAVLLVLAGAAGAHGVGRAAAPEAADATKGAGTTAATVAYPAGYRSWVHVKSTIVGPQHRSFATQGGIHHFYANAKAVEGYRAGRFPDGAVLIDDLLTAEEKDGLTLGASRRRLAVMRKDEKAYSATGGWGFEVFRGDASDGSLTADMQAQCFICHGRVKESVFSELPPDGVAWSAGPSTP